MPAGASQPFWDQKSFCIVSGASQGIGRRIAIEFARKFAGGSVLLLLARSAKGLEETRDRILEANAEVTVVCIPMDLIKGDAALFKCSIEKGLSDAKASAGDFQLALIVHNAGSLGDIGPGLAEHNDAEQWNEFLALNITSAAVLNSEFLKAFPQGVVPHRAVVNITSLCAIQATASMGQYCVAKAAREMFFQVLAEEDPTLDVLSYSPGPVDTDMSDTIINKIKNEKMRDAYIEMKQKKTIVTCEQTAEKCIQVLTNKKYKSGGRVDYYDEGY